MLSRIKYWTHFKFDDIPLNVGINAGNNNKGGGPAVLRFGRNAPYWPPTNPYSFDSSGQQQCQRLCRWLLTGSYCTDLITDSRDKPQPGTKQCYSIYKHGHRRMDMFYGNYCYPEIRLHIYALAFSQLIWSFRNWFCMFTFISPKRPYSDPSGKTNKSVYDCNILGLFVTMTAIHAAFILKHVPSAWKMTEVIMILKSPNEAKSYRPISLSSVILKLYENLLLKRN